MPIEIIIARRGFWDEVFAEVIGFDFYFGSPVLWVMKVAFTIGVPFGLVMTLFVQQQLQTGLLLSIQDF